MDLLAPSCSPIFEWHLLVLYNQRKQVPEANMLLWLMAKLMRSEDRRLPVFTVGKLLTSIQSRTGSVVERLRRTRQNSSHSSSPSDGSRPPHAYLNIDNEPPMIPLRSFGLDIGGMREDLAGPDRGNRDILQTVEFTATESVQSLPQPDSVHTR